jgi:pimeloyl-ACP methyl ester carboxylesterase
VRTFIAALLATMLFTGDAQAQQARQQRVVIGPGDTVAVSSTGSATAPTVVIVPGMLGGAFGFRHVTQALLQAGMRVVVIDPLGYGSSARPRSGDYTLEGQARRIAHAMNAANVHNALLLCHSVGGAICYRLAIMSPERVRGIVAVNSGPDETAASSGMRRALRFAPVIRVVGGAGRAQARLEESLKANSHDPSWVTAEVMERYSAPYNDFGAALNALSAMASAREPEPLAPRLIRIRAPVRLLVGTSGEGGITGADQIAILKQIANLQVTQVLRAGQYIQEEQPRAVVDAVLGLHRALMAAANDR